MDLLAVALGAATDADPSASPSDIERWLVDLVEDAGGRIVWSELVASAGQAGLSPADAVGAAERLSAGPHAALVRVLRDLRDGSVVAPERVAEVLREHRVGDRDADPRWREVLASIQIEYQRRG
jgi:hypothetical protein